MTSDKLQDIIRRKNEHLEDEAVATAGELIDRIGDLQCCIATAQKEILEAQAQLKALEIKKLEPTAILGE